MKNIIISSEKAGFFFCREKRKKYIKYIPSSSYITFIYLNVSCIYIYINTVQCTHTQAKAVFGKFFLKKIQQGKCITDSYI